MITWRATVFGRVAALLLCLALCEDAQAWPRHGAPVGGGPVAPGLVVGTYGSTTATGWSTIGPSTIAQPSGTVTNIIYVSDFLGSDLRDGSTPTFVDDGVTEQFALSSAASPVVNNIYTSPNGNHFTVAVSVTSKTTVQMTSRTGLPDASGTLTQCNPGCGGPAATGPATMAYTTAAPGIHGPVKTLIKGAGGNGPGLYDLDHNGSLEPAINLGDGTGLGTQGNWRTAGGVGSAFGLRSGKPDWLLLRMGDTFVGQAIETGFSSSFGTDNFGLGGFSEQEPMVISAYDENFSVATNGPNVGARARPIVQVPAATTAYAVAQGAGNVHLYQSRDGLHAQGGGSTGYIAIIGIDFYAAQRDAGNATAPPGGYVGVGNIADMIGIDWITKTGLLVEDTHVRWTHEGIGTTGGGNFDVNIRRSQIDHCYSVTNAHNIGTAIDDVQSHGGVMAAGFNYEENVLDLCGYFNPTFTTSDIFSRNAYLQWDALFGNRRGNTSTRSGSENFQFRAGGVIDNNFSYNGSNGFDVGHWEGDPTMASNTVVTNNVVMSPIAPNGQAPIGINFINANNVTASGNIIANQDHNIGPAGTVYAQTDPYSGTPYVLTTTNAGTGGTPGTYAIGAGNQCFGGTNFTGAATTIVSTYGMVIGAGGSITGNLALAEANFVGTNAVGDLLTPVANYPSINTAGTSLSAAGTGGTPGAYGQNGGMFGHCPRDASSITEGDTSLGIPLTYVSGSSAGTDARATFVIGVGGNVTSFEIVSTGQGYQVGDVLTASFGGISGVHLTVNTVAHLSGWTVTVSTIYSHGVHGLTWTGNIVFNWAGQSSPIPNDLGGTHDSPQPGGAGSGTANTFTGNTNCATAQFTGAISASTTLTTSAVVNGTIAGSTNLAGPGVTANTTIVSGGPTSWVISPSNPNISAETMYSYTCTPTKVWADPSRTIQTYAALHGQAASIDGYMAKALTNSKNAPWDPTWTANNGLNPYIRLGFQ
jgi:hypothetical protein